MGALTKCGPVFGPFPCTVKHRPRAVTLAPYQRMLSAHVRPGLSPRYHVRATCWCTWVTVDTLALPTDYSGDSLYVEHYEVAGAWYMLEVPQVNTCRAVDKCPVGFSGSLTQVLLSGVSGSTG